MRKTTETLGSLIEKEVRRQQIGITQFADKIHCTRQHVYRIFAKNDLDVELLARISAQLEHNFFEDIARDYDLANPVPENDEMEFRNLAISKFLDAVPKFFYRNNKDVNIVLCSRPCGMDEDIPLPDFLLTQLNMFFSYETSFEQKLTEANINSFVFDHYSDEHGHTVTIITNRYTGDQMCDILLDYKSEEEWERTLIFAIETLQDVYFPATWNKLEQANQ